MIKGIGVSPGIAIGKVFIKNNKEINVEKTEIYDTRKEIIRLNDARNRAKQEIMEIYVQTLKDVGEEEAQIFEAHKMILDDPELLEKIEEKIIKESINAEYALKEITDNYINIFEKNDNEYIRERVIDIKDVSNRLMRHLLDVEITDLANLSMPVIVVAEDLTPSDTAKMDKNKVLGFITEVGGETAHSSIIARSLQIPAIVGVNKVCSKVKSGDTIVLDGEKGTLIINPQNQVLIKYRKKQREYEEYKKNLKKFKKSNTITKDGFKVKLLANIGTPKDVKAVINNGGEGIGLYRTEFIYMDRSSLPTEDEQYEVYKKVAEALEGKSIIIRTLDIGGDKGLSYLGLSKEVNPFLGYRGIRFCLEETNIFKTQLRAVLRASILGNIKIMFPMISSIEELRKSKKILEEVKEDLRSENIDFNKEIEIGIMVEVPSVAIMSEVFAREVDFFSIGTNDLIQYTMAVDRGNKKVAHLYNQFHPSILRLIKTIIGNGHKEGISVGMCGETASNPRLIPILLGMGLDEVSMNTASILKSREIIRSIEQKKMKEIANKVINLSTSEEVEKYIDKILF